MKRRTTTALLSATVLTLSLPLAGFAFTPGENFFNTWDYDGDGKVTLEEVLERRALLFDGFDADEDGILSQEELADHNAMRDAMQDAQDRPDMAGAGRGRQGGGGQGQGMGRMGGRGYGPRGGPMMQQPGWGYGQPQQGWGYGYGYGQPQGYGYGYGPGWGGQPGMMQPAWGQPQGMAPRGWGQPQGQPGMGQQGMGQQMHAQMDAMLDADGDGRISREEFVKAGEGWLPRFDRNGDGVVDAADFAARRTQ